MMYILSIKNTIACKIIIFPFCFCFDFYLTSETRHKIIINLHMKTHTAWLTIIYFIYDYIYFQDNGHRVCNKNKEPLKSMDQSIRIIWSRDHLIPNCHRPRNNKKYHFNVLEHLYIYTSNNKNSFSHIRFSTKVVRLSRGRSDCHGGGKVVTGWYDCHG